MEQEREKSVAAPWDNHFTMNEAGNSAPSFGTGQFHGNQLLSNDVLNNVVASPFNSANEESDMLVAEGVSAQLKRYGSLGRANNKKYLDCLLGRVQEMEESLKQRDRIIDTLKKELEMSRDHPIGSIIDLDVSTGPLPNFTPECGDSCYRSPRTKTEDDLLNKLRQREMEITVLYERLQQYEDTQTCNAELKNKIVVLESQVKEQAETIEQLNLEIVQKSKNCQKIEAKLKLSTESYVNQLTEASTKIKRLVRSVEDLSRDLQIKTQEHRQTQEELSSLRATVDENFGLEMAYIQEKLKVCHNEEKIRFNQIYDDTLQRYQKTHDTEIACYKKQVESLKNRIAELTQSDRELDAELDACRTAHEAQMASYKECMDSLIDKVALEKDKNELEYRSKMEKFAVELDNYKYQVENFEKKQADEIRKVEIKCATQIEQYRKKCECEFLSYKKCSEDLRHLEEDFASVSAQLRDILSKEAHYREQYESFKTELDQSKDEIKNLGQKLRQAETKEANTLQEYAKCKAELEICFKNLAAHEEKLVEKDKGEELLLSELRNAQTMISEYEIKINETNKKYREEMSSVESRHKRVVASFQEEIETLNAAISQLKLQQEKKISDTVQNVKTQKEREVNDQIEKLKFEHQQEIDKCMQQLIRQNQQIMSIEEVAECDLDEVLVRIKDLKSSNEDLNKKLNLAEISITNYEDKLMEFQSRFEKDIILYQNEILKLTEELKCASLLEERIVQQLSNQVTGVKESKDRIKGLIERNEIRIYCVENNGDFPPSRFEDGVVGVDAEGRLFGSQPSESEGDRSEMDRSSDENKILYMKLNEMSNENQILRLEINSLKKRTGNASVQTSPNSSEHRKKSIEEALLNELEKELELHKQEIKEKEEVCKCVIAENSKLKDKMEELSHDMYEMQHFLSAKIDENEFLLVEKAQLESHLESITPPGVITNPELQKHLMFSKFSKHLKKNFNNAATSTPNFDHDDVEEATPKRRIKEFTTSRPGTDGHLETVKWFRRCEELENQNCELQNEIESLRLKVKEIGYCRDKVTEEMNSFQEIANELEERIDQLESKKIEHWEMEQINEKMKLRNDKLEEERQVLKNEITQLKEENLNIEKKYEERNAKLLSELSETEGWGEAFESLVMNLNKKSEEVLLLKEEIMLKQETIDSIENDMAKSNALKMEMNVKLDMLISELRKAEEEVLNIKRDKLQVGLEKRLLEGKLAVIKEHNEELINNQSMRVKINSTSSVISLVESLEKEIVDLRKDLTAERAVIDRMMVEKSSSHRSGDSQSSEVSYRNEFINAFQLLKEEKEELRRKVLELEGVINAYVEKGEVDEELCEVVKESQQKLLLELEAYGKQHSELERTLLETENLKSKVENTEHKLIVRTKEKLETEEILEGERQELRNALKRINFLEKQLVEKSDIVKVLSEEKEVLQNNLLGLQQKLCSMEEHLQTQKLILEGEIQERELRVRHAQLEFRAGKLDADLALTPPIVKVANLEETDWNDVEKVTTLRDKWEREHERAIMQLKQVYTSDVNKAIEVAARQQRKMEKIHQDQVTLPLMMTPTNPCMQY